MMLLAAILAVQAVPPQPYAMPGEDHVDPYVARPENLGTTPFSGPSMASAFHGQAGIHRVVHGMLDRAFDDPVTGEIFKSHDRKRLSRTLFEQFCTILNAGCSYSGRDMASAHRDLGVMQADMNRLVELLQQSMKDEGISFAAQNRFLSKLAPMRKDVVER